MKEIWAPTKVSLKIDKARKGAVALTGFAEVTGGPYAGTRLPLKWSEPQKGSFAGSANLLEGDTVELMVWSEVQVL